MAIPASINQKAGLSVVNFWITHSCNSGVGVRGQSPRTPPPKHAYLLGLNEYYHGTSMDAAVDILDNKVWMVGDSKPPGIWLTLDFSYAANMQEDGVIVVVRCDLDPMTHLNGVKDGEYFRFDIEGAVPYAEYYEVDDLTPIHILNLKGRIIRSSNNN
jgi:hypothetical protein